VPIAQSLSFHVLAYPSLCGLQLVSASCSHFLSVSWLIPPSVVFSMWVPRTWSFSFHFMTLFLLLHSPGSKYPLLVYFQWTNVFLPSYIFQKVIPFLYLLGPCVLTSLLLCTADSFRQTTIIQLQCTVIIFSDFILVSPMHFQPPLCISSDDTHHTMIGTFPLYASVFSDVQNSDNSYSGPCLPFLCLPILSDT